MIKKSNNLREPAKQIVDTLKKGGFEAYFVGGCVRDLVMKLVPKDYDIATSAKPDEIISLFPKTIEVGKAFGVITVVIDKQNFEVATFRSEQGYSDGRHPAEVHFTNAKEDVLRRDFTINGLLYDPDKEKVIDYVNGEKDIKNKIVRTIGDPAERFKEDKLRMMRAIRFAARFNFKIDPDTWTALTKFSKDINSISKERIRDEMTVILTQGNADKGIELLDQAGLLKIILPELPELKGVEQPPQFHPEGDVWVHTMLMLKDLKDPSPELGWAVLLHDIAKPKTFSVSDRIRFNEHDRLGAEMADDILRRLKCSNKTIEHVTSLIAQHLRFKDAPKMRESKLKRFIRQEHFEDHLELHRLDCVSSHGQLDIYEFCKNKLFEIPPEEIKPTRLVTGTDLIKLGLPPGPKFSAILTDVENEQLEGTLKTPQDALEFVKKKYL